MRASLVAVAVLLSGCSASTVAPESGSGTDAVAEPCLRRVLVDEQVKPVAGATLTVRATSATATTDEQGGYCLEFSSGESVVDVSAPPRAGTMTCRMAGPEPDGCDPVRWT